MGHRPLLVVFRAVKHSRASEPGVADIPSKCFKSGIHPHYSGGTKKSIDSAVFPPESPGSVWTAGTTLFELVLLREICCQRI